MGFDLLKQRGKLTGFSRMLGTPESQFIFLSDNTNGRCGRSVYIDNTLTKVFMEHVKAEDFDLVMFRLEQLRATAGGLQSYSSMDNAFEHFSTVGRFQVGYKIFQSTNSADKKPGVYITSLEAYKVEGDRPGLYNVKYVNDEWKVKKGEQITNTYAAVNGLTEGLEMAADETIPPMLESAYSSKEYKDSVKDGYSLLYNPPELYYKGMRWKTPKNKVKGKDFTAKLLGNAMLDAQRRGQQVNWVVHGNGAKVFLQAMERISNQTLDKHQVFFNAAKGDLLKVLPLVRKSGMKLHEGVMSYQGDDWSLGNFKNRTSSGVANEVAKFGKNYEQKAATMHLDATDNRFKVAKLALKLGAVPAAFTAIPAVLPAMGASIATASALGATAKVVAVGAALRDTQSYRNMASVNLSDPDLNPHFHAGKSQNEMRAHVNAATGGVLKSFAALVKAQLKGRR